MAKLSAIGGWLATTFGGVLAGTSSDTGARSGEVKARKSAGVPFKELVAVVGPFVFIAGLLIGVSVAVHLIILNLSSYGESWSIETLYECHWFFLTMSGGLGALGMLGGGGFGRGGFSGGGGGFSGGGGGFGGGGSSGSW